MKNKVEILAPAGSMESLKAALLAGANAVYLGGEKFSARVKACNFSLGELQEAISYAHLRKAKVYIAVNVLIADQEIAEALRFIEDIYQMGIDAVIVQSLGLAYHIKKKFPQLDIHASTQMTVQNYYGAKLLEELGFSRVVVARETSLEEIQRIRENTNLEIEVFVHGALCVCYSGQCLMSSMIGGRSGNRGACAQPCRKSYEILDINKQPLSSRKYFLSPKDLNTLDSLQSILQSGATSLKIEGRMKRPQYVYEIVSSYKKALSGMVTDKEKEEVRQIFNRGFTKGIFQGDFGKNFIAEDRPDNRGIAVGRVQLNERRGCRIELDCDIVKNDGLEFETRAGRKGWKADRFLKKGNHRLSLPFSVKEGSVINRTLSAELEENLESQLRGRRSYRPLEMEVLIEVGKAPIVNLTSEEYEITYSPDFVVEESIKSPISKEKIYENLSKLQDTVFELVHVEVEIKGNAFLRISQVNQLRRESIALLEEKILTFPKREIHDFQWKGKHDGDKLSGVKIVLNSSDDVKELNLKEVQQIIIPWGKREEFSLVDLSHQTDIAFVFQKIYTAKELDDIYEELQGMPYITGIYLNNISQVQRFRNLPLMCYADVGLNIFSSEDLRLFHYLGIKSAVLSLELQIAQIRKMAKEKIMPLEMIVYGRPVVMTMEHCPYALVKGCQQNYGCNHCEYQNYYLRDEKGVDFEVRRKGHLTEILNSYPIFLEREIEEIHNLGIGPVILADDFVKEVVALYKGKCNSALREKLVKKYHNLTKGHYHRGILNG